MNDGTPASDGRDSFFGYHGFWAPACGCSAGWDSGPRR